MSPTHRPRFFLVLTALALSLLCASGARAQVDPVYTPPATQESPTAQSVTLSRSVYQQLLTVEDTAEVAANLTQLLRRAGEVCASVTDFQIIYRKDNEQRVKLKCPGKPNFGLIVNQGGRVLVFGGDGMVGDFEPGDGVVFAISGTVRAPLSVRQDERARKDRKGPDLGESGNLPGLLQGGDPNKIPTWLVFLVVINGFIVLALLLSFAWFMRAKTQVPERPEEPIKTGISSLEKDKLIIDSREILPDIYHHPEGFFISRGKRGKRRLFGNLFFALIYREYGFKFREIR
ncbi:MAG: hypothetical protein AAF337_04630 [Pseudomonadota bacterium]